MSKDQEAHISIVINWSVKIIVGIASFLLVMFFLEIKNDIKQLSSDVNLIKERMARMEGSLNK